MAALRRNSRWMLRDEDNYSIEKEFDFDGENRFSVVIYLNDLTDETFKNEIVKAIDRGLLFAGNDYLPSGDDQYYDATIRGNAKAVELMRDYDDALDAGKTLAINFEIANPLGDRPDTDWVGGNMYRVFGEGWTGRLDPTYKRGYQYTHMTKKQVFERVMHLAHLGWQVRVSY
ncbi:hypothetical protein F5Y08DRAFT_334218 [Xylaria arbuscula]|nr:hypothetical protein F5Y08DRAFT_334218 [Xylaria arbuscula]